MLLALNKIFPSADLYTSVYNKQNASWAKVFNVKTSFLQNFPKAKTSHQLYAALMPVAFESFNFDGYDLVISVTSEAAKGIITKPHTLHICYCLTPTRYLWSGYADYFRNPFLRFFSKPVVSYLRKWDKIAAQRPDYFIAISKEVQNRIKKYYGRESEIIYPPLSSFPSVTNRRSRFSDDARRTMPQSSKSSRSLSENLSSGQTQNDVTVFDSPQNEAPHGFVPATSYQSSIINNHKTENNGGYFLVVSRLEYISYKKVEIAIEACNRLKLPLKIVGVGRGEKKLKSIAGQTVEFLGQLTDGELSFYYKNCRALIFPGLEDFGLVMAEAQAFGKPVIAFRGGGALDIIKEGITGEFFNEQTSGSLEEVLVKFNSSGYNSKLCKENAEKFSFGKFEENFKRFLEGKLKV